MNIPDPRHAAATAPIAAPAGPQWGGQAPSVIDPALIAHIANSFFNASPGQMPDPAALANFAATQERPPAPPTSIPGAIGAGAALPGTSVPGAQSVPFTTQVPVSLLDAARAPAQHIPAEGLASGITGVPAGAAAPPASQAAVPGPSPEKGQQPRTGLSDGASLSAVPQTLGPITALVPPTVPARFSQGLPGASALPASLALRPRLSSKARPMARASQPKPSYARKSSQGSAHCRRPRSPPASRMNLSPHILRVRARRIISSMKPRPRPHLAKPVLGP
jgi:cysteine desulfurase / selenocysteine lyase